MACLSGNYERGDDYNLSEAFLRYGAGLYVGATEVSHRDTNDTAAKRFFSNWEPHETIGQIINSTKRHVWNQDLGLDNGKLWAYEYNIYGCPKYGRTVETGIYSADQDGNPAVVLARSPDATTLNVNLPAFQVETVEGKDRVSLPGGGLIMEPGYPEVPVWIVTQRFSAGTPVQDVRLTSRRSGSATTGLALGYHQPQHDCEGCPPIPPVDPASWDGWWPPLEPAFDWWVEENHDNSTTLYLRVFPFHVFSDGYTALFHRSFVFEIDTVRTRVSIAVLRARESVVHQERARRPTSRHPTPVERQPAQIGGAGNQANRMRPRTRAILAALLLGAPRPRRQRARARPMRREFGVVQSPPNRPGRERATNTAYRTASSRGQRPP